MEFASPRVKAITLKEQLDEIAFPRGRCEQILRVLRGPGRVEPALYSQSGLNVPACPFLRSDPLEVDLESHLEDVHAADLIEVAVHVVRHHPRVGVEVPVEAQRDIAELSARDVIIVVIGV